MDARTYPAKATPKSLRTRARILDAAMRLFAEMGYHAATNGHIADAAKLTRGAMLYHFATREELVEAAIAHIEVARARLFEDRTQRSIADHIFPVANIQTAADHARNHVNRSRLSFDLSHRGHGIFEATYNLLNAGHPL